MQMPSEEETSDLRGLWLTAEAFLRVTLQKNQEQEGSDRDGWGLFYHPELTTHTPHLSVNLDNRMRRNTFHLREESANFFCKGLGNKSFRLTDLHASVGTT